MRNESWIFSSFLASARLRPRVREALLKNLFGEQQLSALADYIQAALMLNYNSRVVG